MALARPSLAALRYQFAAAGRSGATPRPYRYRSARLFMEAALPSAAAFSYQCLAFAKSCGISRPCPRESALPSRNIKVGLAGSALSADRHADSACEGSIFLVAKTFRPTARGDPSSGTLESCAHSKSGAWALPTCVENPAKVIAKKAMARRHTHLRVISRLRPISPDMSLPPVQE